ncbi:hypothetical protein CCR85_04705 [Rhodothalassium salexigens]|uniref:photosynthetic reaction center subunit H n=1 Tax=Rhodothalassium salexigens TaxID=1086 RepID=UPI001912EABD|nr:photosynthetic reaction center subunit H [Rhodothalassium salexigens]MBK5910793.1 hypothetical protein [Rhodothalassium salexigens]MBK5920539.1 hypothetical protein [Rhodothalassium salexigens]
METGALTGYIDVAQVTLYVFWIFFAGLIFYLRREDRREGYPLEKDDGTPEDVGLVWFPKPKEFTLPHGRGTATAGRKDQRKLPMEKVYAWEGSPFEATGDPMADGVGPASWAERDDHPDLTLEGTNKVVPLRADPDYYPCDGDDDPRGMTVFGADGKAVGTVGDLWIDKADLIARYLEVELADQPKPAPAPAPKPTPAPTPVATASEGAAKPEGEGQTAAAAPKPAPAPAPAPTPKLAKKKTVMVPREFMRVKGPNTFFNKLIGLPSTQPGIYVSALNAEDFKNIPQIKGNDQITALEEEKITAYFGGGRLYSTKEHAGPAL